MNVYIIRFDGGTIGDSFGGGMAIVVANDQHEAYETMANCYNNSDDFYDEFSTWYCTENAVEECLDLATDLTEPKIIAFNFYRE